MNRVIISVDFDGTLTIGNRGTIQNLQPNVALIQRLNNLRSTTDIYIKIVTARGARAGLSLEQKAYTYHNQIATWLKKHNVPYDLISFNKEYAHIYVDDMSVLPNAELNGFISYYTGNRIIDTGATIVKHCKTAEIESAWYELARAVLKNTSLTIPDVLFSNKDILITKKYHQVRHTTYRDLFQIAMRFKEYAPINTYSYSTYVDNIVVPKGASDKVKTAVSYLPEFAHDATFYHGDLSIDNCIITDYGKVLIDPNPKVFGSYITDMGKAVISCFAAGLEVPHGSDIFAIAEGCRVAKYKPEFIEIVNTYAERL